MKKTGLLTWVLISQVCLADQTTLLTSVSESPQPTQQFVTSIPDKVAIPAPYEADPDFSPHPLAISQGAPASTSSTNALATVATAEPPAKAPAEFTVASSAIPLGLGAIDRSPTDNPFAGGLDIPLFEQCKGWSLTLCSGAKDLKQFQACYSHLQQPTCKQFIAFATATGMAPGDDIDFIKHYKQAQLDLVHLVHVRANYPGIYYTINNDGDLTDLIFGPQTQLLDIRKDLHYPEIAGRFPNVELFSIVDKLPEIDIPPNDKGLRLIFRFELLNGCHACERAGYAKVAYDFNEAGALQASSILSLEPAP